MNIIGYARTNTILQGKETLKLDYQINSINEYCKINDFSCIKIYSDFSSGMNYERDELYKLNEFIMETDIKVDKIIITRWIDLGRDTDKTLQLIKHWENLGIDVISIEQPIDDILLKKIILGLHI